MAITLGEGFPFSAFRAFFPLVILGVVLVAIQNLIFGSSFARWEWTVVHGICYASASLILLGLSVKFWEK